MRSAGKPSGASSAGVELDDGPVRADACRVVDQALGRTLVELVIHEGRNRIVRRLFDALGHPVRGLVRTAIADVRLGDLPTGATRHLQRAELAALLDATADGSPGTAPAPPKKPVRGREGPRDVRSASEGAPGGSAPPAGLGPLTSPPREH